MIVIVKVIYLIVRLHE